MFYPLPFSSIEIARGELAGEGLLRRERGKNEVL